MVLNAKSSVIFHWVLCFIKLLKYYMHNLILLHILRKCGIIVLWKLNIVSDLFISYFLYTNFKGGQVMEDQTNFVLNVEYAYSSIAEWIDLERLGLLIIAEAIRMLQERNYLPDVSGVF